MNNYHFELNIHDMEFLDVMLHRVLVTDINKLKTLNVGAVACNEILKGVLKRIGSKIGNAQKSTIKVKLQYVEMRVLVEVLKVTPHVTDYELSVKRQVLFFLDKHSHQLPI